jgi:hypothetical protein
VENKFTHRREVVLLVILGTLVACAINIDSTIVREVDLWARVAIPVSLVIGALGAVRPGRRWTLPAVIIAWVGIAFFSLVVVGTGVPDESIRSTDNPQGPGWTFLAIRFSLLLALAVASALAMFKLTRFTRNSSAN